MRITVHLARLRGGVGREADRRAEQSEAGVSVATRSPASHSIDMPTPPPLIDDDEANAEARALAAAIAEADADPRTVPHEEVRAWLLRLAQGEFDAPPPEPN